MNSQVYLFENVAKWELIFFRLVGLDFGCFCEFVSFIVVYGEFFNSHEKAESSFMQIDPACHLKNFGQ